MDSENMFVSGTGNNVCRCKSGTFAAAVRETQNVLSSPRIGCRRRATSYTRHTGFSLAHERLQNCIPAAACVCIVSSCHLKPNFCFDWAKPPVLPINATSIAPHVAPKLQAVFRLWLICCGLSVTCYHSCTVVSRHAISSSWSLG